MTGASTCPLWLTAMATVSLAVTGCSGPGSQRPHLTAASAPTAHPHHRSPSVRATPTPSSDPAVSATPSTPSPAAQPTTQRSPFVLVSSDGSSTVHVARRTVRFPGSVTDAVVSPNGMVIAFVDGLGNIATARLDGTGLRVLTATDAGLLRAQPTFEDGGSEIVFSERGHDGVWRLKEVAADGHDDLVATRRDPTVPETEADGGGDTAPSATWFQASHNATTHSVMAFEHRTARGVVKVYVTDRNQRGSGSYPLLPGRSPAVSPTGDRVAFIGSGGELEVQAMPVPGRKPHPTQVTWGAHPTGHLAWSPDGRRLVFSTRRDVETVASMPPRPGRNPVRVVLGHPGVGTFGTLARPVVGVYPGTDPVAAAVAVSRAHFVAGTDMAMDETDAFGLSWATRVTLVGADDPTAAATAAAMADGGPLLFVRDGRLDPRVRDEIVRLLHRPRGLRRNTGVDIVGTTGAVPDSVASELQALGFTVRRFAPEAAAADVARTVRGDDLSYVVVSDTDLPAVASSVGTTTPVLLTHEASMPAATAARIDTMPRDAGAMPTVYAVGREAQEAVQSSWPGKRPFHIVDLGGSDPFANSLAAVQGLYDAPGRLAVTTVADWRDTLIATMVGPTLVLDERHGLDGAVRGWLTASGAALRAIHVFGGSAALPGTVGRAVYGDRFVVRRSPADILG
jgi:WD40-like Beta Propeller Repeat